MEEEDWKPDIFSYVDYRAYLGDYYRAAKENVSAFSYRYLARRAGFSSPNFIKLVIDGDRNLGADSIESVAGALKLDSAERRFFRALVHFDQADSAKDKNEAFEQIAASRRFRHARRIEHDMFEYLSHWYYPAIREMAARDDFRADPEWIARQLFPSITEARASKALDVLFRLGVLERDEDEPDTITRGDPSLTTGHEVGSLAIGNYHRQMLERAGASIEEVDRDLRDVSALTVCISESMVDELKSRIHQFREILLDLCDSDEAPQTVYQINFQLFPLTQSAPPSDEEDS
jgi:uncharacterized protein (TIGR02147 family)